jgi:pimeloyl-ACP methyl ester carboxylesterase
MFDAGMRFVLIKGSDAQEAADIATMKWLVGDRNAAQAAGLYTGMYHFAYLPNSEDSDYVNPTRISEISAAFPSAKFIGIEGAGHWVHAQQPAKLQSVVLDFVKNLY